MRLLPLLLTALALGLLAGCGGGDGDQADSNTDVNQLLKDTFSGKQEIKSGKLDIRATVAAGGQSFDVALGGPFENEGQGKVPKLDLDLTASGAGQEFKAGVTSTGDQAFVSWDNTAYKISDTVFQQLKASIEQQSKQANQDNPSLGTLGIDPSKWLTNARNAGEAKVGDADTIKITGDVDVPKLLDDVNTALERLRSLGGSSAAGLPDQLSEQDKQQAADAVKQLSAEIYTGAEDKILRRLVIALKLEVPQQSGSAQSADIKFDMQFLDVNEGQDIAAPANARSFEELVAKLQELGISSSSLGGIQGGPGSGSSGGASEQNLEKYSQCIQDANQDPAKVRKCADLLTTP